MDDRKKKLEELKAKNALLKTQITKTTAPTTGPTPTSSMNSAVSKADEVMKSVTNSRANAVGMDVLKQQSNILKDHMNRYRSEILSVSKLSQSYLKVEHEMYDEFCQVDMRLENQVDSDEEDKKRKIEEKKRNQKQEVVSKEDFLKN